MKTPRLHVLIACVAATAFAQDAPPAAGLNRAAIERLRQTIDAFYSHRDRVVKDWPARFASAAAGLHAAKSAEEFASRAADLLSAADDPHLTVLAGGRTLPTCRRVPVRNADPKRLPAVLASYKQESNWVLTGRTRDGFGYVLIAQWPAPDSPVLAPVHAAIDAWIAGKTPAIIVDVRVNGGGNDLSALAVAERFAARPMEICRTRTRSPELANGWSPWHPRILQPAPAARRYTGRVAVLCGPACMSSNETFLLMMRAAGAKLAGARSFGSSGNPKPFDLGNGVTVRVPTWEEIDPNGHPVEGRGIEPDIAAEFGADPARDGVIEAATNALRGN